MQRPIIKWIIFVLCLQVFVGVLAWITQRTWNMETLRIAAEQDAQVQERIRLALWRMDSLASTLLIRENSRPPGDYQAFRSPDDLFTRDYKEITKGKAFMPSPLLGEPPEFVLLHFEMMPQAAPAPFVCSPQVPTGSQLELANNWYAISPQLKYAADRLAKLDMLLKKHPEISRRVSPQDKDQIAPLKDAKEKSMPPAPAAAEPKAVAQAPLPVPAPGSAPTDRQMVFNVQEQVQRSNVVQQQIANEKLNSTKVPLRKSGDGTLQLYADSESKKQDTTVSRYKSSAAPAAASRAPASPPAGGANGTSVGTASLNSTLAPVPSTPMAAAKSEAAAVGDLSAAKPALAKDKAKLIADNKPASATALSRLEVAPAPAQAPAEQRADDAPMKRLREAAIPASETVTTKSGTADTTSFQKSLAGTNTYTGATAITGGIVALGGKVEDLRAASSSAPAAPSDLKPMWLEHELLLVRNAVLDGKPRLQGVWVDWEKLRGQLLGAVTDLLPNASLAPSIAEVAHLDPSALVTLPVKLTAGAISLPITNGWSALQRALAIAWICLAAAAVAIALVLHRAMLLSERRGAFVSAVTHELRTPLTTFQLYSEMLADDMVPDATKRKEYLRTLCDESTRLTHLVENVLAYSRIERGRTAARVERVTIADLIARIEPRLHRRCSEIDLTLEVSLPEAVATLSMNVDAMGVEQILFNLVDNACKYAAPKSDPSTLHLDITADGPHIIFRIRDHGPGISRQQQKRLFQPFEKSATDAAHSAPGVGLGLALCRRLAKEMGGDLTLEKSDGGACFALRLPLI